MILKNLGKIKIILKFEKYNYKKYQLYQKSKKLNFLYIKKNPGG